jgi:hypothetical protein
LELINLEYLNISNLYDLEELPKWLEQVIEDKKVTCYCDLELLDE